MATQQFEQISKMAKSLDTSEQLLLVEQLIAWIRSKRDMTTEEDMQSEPEIWNEDELRQLLDDNQPMTTQEFLEAGLFGGWEDVGIEDSVKWVEEQRAKTRDRYSW